MPGLNFMIEPFLLGIWKADGSIAVCKQWWGALFASGFYICVRSYVSINRAVAALKRFDMLSDQYQHLTVYTAALVIRYICDFAEHLLFYSD